MNFQPRGINDRAIQGPASYASEIGAAKALLETQPTWNGVTAEAVARMRLQNRFKTGLDIARYTAALMRADMAAYDADPTKYTQSLGCWHGFIAQQKLISVKKHFGGKTDRRYLYLSGWMIAALRSEFGPLPDQSMHEKTSVPALIEELYTFLRQADSRELNDIFRAIDAARKAGDTAKEKELIEKVDNFQTHVVPVIADIDAGFGNAEATYLLAKKMIEAGACALQIENQVSDEKQCGHQDGKVTVPHEVFLAKIRACRHAFLELGVEDGVVVTRTDSLGAGLTQQIAVSHKPGDIGDQYNSFLDCEEVTADNARNGDVIINRNGKMMRPKRLASNLYQFRAGTGEDRCVLDSITSLQNGADLLVDRDREAAYRADRQDGRPHSRGRSEREAGLQQLAVVQLDAQLPLAGLRRDEGSRQGCQQVQPGRPDEAGIRRYAAWHRSRRAHPHLPGRFGKARRHLPPPDHVADLSHGSTVDGQSRKRVFRRAGHAGLCEERSAPGDPSGHRLRQASEHGRLRYRRRAQGILRR